MKTNDVKKGMRVRLTESGWLGTMMDNKKGNIRDIEVEGVVTEIGSVYAFKIEAVLVDEEWVFVELTDKQIKHRDSISIFGF